MEWYVNNIEYKSYGERCQHEVEHESRQKSVKYMVKDITKRYVEGRTTFLEFLVEDMTTRCIEDVGSKLDGTPKGQKKTPECYPGKFPTCYDKYMDSNQRMPHIGTYGWKEPLK